MTTEDLIKENERLRGDIHYVRMLLRPPDTKPTFSTMKELASHLSLLVEEGYTILTSTEEYGQPKKEVTNVIGISESQASEDSASAVGERVTQREV